jgi:hypothetical protein
MIGGEIGSFAFALIPPETTQKLIAPSSDWQKLSPSAQSVLKPLEEKWPSMNSLQREKWLSVTKKFDRLSIGEQNRIHRRMKRWSEVPSDQKSLARKNFKAFSQNQSDKNNDALSAWKSYSASRNPKPENDTSPTPGIKSASSGEANDQDTSTRPDAHVDTGPKPSQNDDNLVQTDSAIYK